MKAYALMVLGFGGWLLGCGSIAPEDPKGPRFVAVGAEGTIVASQDGKSFVATTSGTTANLTSVAYGAGVVVAVGEDGMIVASKTGLDFTTQYSPTDVDLAHVIFTGERFIAVGGNDEVGAVSAESKDGLTWERTLAPSSFTFHAAASKSDTAIAAAYLRSDLQTPALFTAQPGKDWEESVGPDFYDSVETAAGVFTVGGGAVNHFVDGLGWQSTPLPGSPAVHAMAWDEKNFVVVGEQGAIFTSPDGKTFQDHSISDKAALFNGVAFGNGTLVAVGQDGHIEWSADGTTWAKATSPTTKHLRDAAFTPGPAN